MKTIEERMNNPIVAEDLLGALVVFNSDPALIEFIEDADFTVESLAKCHLTYYLPDDEKFEEACQKLDLDPIVNAVKCVWFFYDNSYLRGHICFREDWIYG